MKKFAHSTVVALFLSLLTAVATTNSAQAVPASLDETFTGATLLNPNNWVLNYANTNGQPNVPPCLTAASSGTTINLAGGTSIKGCASPAQDAPGTGALILNGSYDYQSTSILYDSALPTSAGLDIAFYQAQYGPDGGQPADGLSFYLKKGTMTNTAAGQIGYGLGYEDIPGALFGIGFDVFGNFSSPMGTPGRSGCANAGPAQPFSSTHKYSIVLRGPDTSPGQDGSLGYCYLDGKVLGSSYFGNSTTTRLEAGKPVRIIVDPSTDANPKIRVYTWTSGSPTQDIATAQSLIVDQPASYKSTPTFKFGFAASTGGAHQTHAIWGLNIAPVVETSLDTLYIVPDDITVTGGNTPTYTYSVRTVKNDPSKTIVTTNLTNFAPKCTSTYTTMTSGPTTLPISCTGSSIAFYKVDSSSVSTLTVNKGAPRVAPATVSITGKSGVAITPTAGFTNADFSGAVTYSIAPALPSGLSLNTSTGVVSGTSAVAVPTQQFVVTATSGAETATANLSVNITASPAITPATQTLVAKVGTAITATTALTPANFAGAPTFSISPALPTGLVLNTATGVITGTATVTSVATNYTITATQGTDSATAKVNITVNSQPAITPSTQSIAAKVGTVITPSAPLVAANFAGTVSYSISPTLPAGLTFNTFTGVISGTPTNVISTTVETVTATDGVDTATAQITISSRLVPLISPSGYVLSGNVGTALTPSVAMEAKYFTGTVRYSITPALPAGLSLDATTGVISGTPTTAIPLSPFVLSGGDGTDTATSNVQILISASTVRYSVTYLPNSGTGNMAVDSGLGTTFNLTANQYSRTGFNFAGWKDAAGNSYVDGQNLKVTSDTNLVLTAQWTAISVKAGQKTGQPDVITLMDPGSGIVGTTIVITGKFSLKITDIQWAGNSLPAGSWVQTPTTVTFKSQAAAPNESSTIQLINGATPALSLLTYVTVPTELPPPAPLINYPKYLISDGVVGYDGVKLILAFDTKKTKPTKSHLAALKKYMVKLNKTVSIVGYSQAAGKKTRLKYANLRAQSIKATIMQLYPKAKITWKASAVRKNKACGDFTNKCVVIVAK